MKRKTRIAACAGGLALALAAALYFGATYRDAAAPKRAFWLNAEAPTRPGWRARLTLLAGDGGDGMIDGPAAASRFGDPFGVATDRAGNLFVADAGAASRIRRIAPDGRVVTFAGSRSGFADGPAAVAAFDTPSALAIDRHGNLYVADTGNNAIRKLAPDGSVSTLAGGGEPGYRDGVGRAARFDGPVGVAVDAAGDVYVADTYNDRIRRIKPDGTVTTVAGSGAPGHMDGSGAAARFDTPSAIVAGKDGLLYVADTGNDAIRRIDKAGAVSTLAPPPDARLLWHPAALALTHDGYLYVGGAGGRILQRDPGGQYRVLADADHRPQADDGGDDSLRLAAPRAIALRPGGSLVVTDGQALRVFALAPPRAGAAAAPVLPLPPSEHVADMPWPVSPQLAPHEVVGVLGEVAATTMARAATISTRAWTSAPTSARACWRSGRRR